MPIIKSAIKRNKQAQSRRQHNLVVKAAIRSDVKAVAVAMTEKDVAKTSEALRAAISEIDRAVKKGTLHANTAARKKSRLNAKVKAAMGEATKPAKVTKAKPAASKATAAKPKTTAKKATPKKS